MVQIIRVYDTETNALNADASNTGMLVSRGTDAPSNAGCICNNNDEITYYVYNRYYYRIDANEPVQEFHIDWDDGVDNSSKKANVEIIKCDPPSFYTVVEHMYTEAKRYFPLIRTKSIDGYLSKWYTNDGGNDNDFSKLEPFDIYITHVGNNEFSTVSLEKTGQDLIPHFIPANLPPVGILKVDKKHIFAGIDNKPIENIADYPLLYAYSNQSSGTPPSVKLTVQGRNDKATREYTLAANNVVLEDDDLNEEVGSSGELATRAVPTGNFGSTPTLTDCADKLVRAELLNATALGDDDRIYIKVYDAVSANLSGNVSIGIDTTVCVLSNGNPIVDLSDTFHNVSIDGSESFSRSSNVDISTYYLDDDSLNFGAGATATITITDYTELNTGDNVNLVATDGTNYDFEVGDQSSVDGTWESTTSNDATATNLMNVINTSSGPSGTRFTATVAGAVVTATQATGGVAGHTTVTLTDAGTDGMSKTNFTATIQTANTVTHTFGTYGGVDDNRGNVSDSFAAGLSLGSVAQKKLSYSYDNVSHVKDSNGRFYDFNRLLRLQVEDNHTVYSNDGDFANRRSWVEHYDDDNYVSTENQDAGYSGSGLRVPASEQTRGLLLFSNDNDPEESYWQDIGVALARNSTTMIGASGAYILRYAADDTTDTNIITGHPKNHILLCKTDKFDSVYFRLENTYAESDNAADIDIAAYYSTTNGWKPLEIIDNTLGLKTSGSIQFQQPPDWNKIAYDDIESGTWTGPVSAVSTVGARADDPATLWDFDAYGVIFSININESTGTASSKVAVKNIWPYNNTHSQLIKIIDPHHVSLNGIAISQAMSFARQSKVISITDRLGKSVIRKIGASGGQVTFGGVDLGDVDASGNRKQMKEYQQNATPVYIDVTHTSGEKTRFYGIITGMGESHPTGGQFPKYSLTFQVSHIIEMTSGGNLLSDKISIGGNISVSREFYSST